MCKTLYFEGAGIFLAEYGDLGNCRLRTAFADDGGRVIYLEANGFSKSKDWRKLHPEFDGIEIIGTVSHLFEITGDYDDCNINRLPQSSAVFAWCRAGLLGLVNSLGCSFDAVEVLPGLSGYSVHDGRGGYNRGDLFAPDWDSIRKAEEIKREELRVLRDAGERFPCVMVWRDPGDADLLHVRHPRADFSERNKDVRLGEHGHNAE